MLTGLHQQQDRPTLGSLFPDAGLMGRDATRNVPGWFHGYNISDFPGLTADAFLGKDKLRRRDILGMYNPMQQTQDMPVQQAASPTPYQKPTPNNVFSGSAMAPLTFGSMLARQPTL